MAIFHLSAKVFSRSKGHSACAAAAYRSANLLVDCKTGEVHDYRNKNEVSNSQIFAPDNAPAWCFNRMELWNRVELAEKRKDSQLAREYEMALPVELSTKLKIKLAQNFAQGLVKCGMVVDMSIHNLKGENPHVHMLCTLRHISPDGFKGKNRDLNSKKFIEKTRHFWSDLSNGHLKIMGVNERIDHRSFERQLKEKTPVFDETQEQANQRFESIKNKIPQIHLGKKLHHMEKKNLPELKYLDRYVEYKRRSVFNEINEKELSNLDRDIYVEQDTHNLMQFLQRQDQLAEEAHLKAESDEIEEMYESYRDDGDMSQFSTSKSLKQDIVKPKQKEPKPYQPDDDNGMSM